MEAEEDMTDIGLVPILNRNHQVRIIKSGHKLGYRTVHTHFDWSLLISSISTNLSAITTCVAHSMSGSTQFDITGDRS